MNNPRTLVLALKSTEPGVAAKACEALEKFAEACKPLHVSHVW